MYVHVCDKCGTIIKNKSDLYSVSICTYDQKGFQIGVQNVDLCSNCHIRLTGFLKEKK